MPKKPETGHIRQIRTRIRHDPALNRNLIDFRGRLVQIVRPRQARRRMNGYVDIYTLIFLAIAVVIFLRLRSVLGRRTGSERPPFDPFSKRPDARPESRDDKVVSLPRRTEEREAPAPRASVEATAEERVKTVAPPGSPVAAGLKTIAQADAEFETTRFIAGAKAAYEMIVTAFAEGDRKVLKQLLSKDVFDGFIAAITQRETRQEKIEFRFVGIDKAEITGAALKNGTAQVTVKFLSKLISATRDKAGAVIDGDPVHVSDVTDIWTFARDVASRDPNWKLIATESVE
jgi:predicted lipid-binding transport protein (Tim44 family)